MKLLIVFALACGHRDVPRESVKPVPAIDAAIDTPVDAPIMSDASIDAPIDASVDAPVALDQPSPPVYVGKIMAVAVDNGGSLLTVDFGKKRGLDMSWKAVLLDDDNKRGEKLEMIGVDERRCRVRSKLPPSLLGKYRRVVFEP